MRLVAVAAVFEFGAEFHPRPSLLSIPAAGFMPGEENTPPPFFPAGRAMCMTN